MSGASNLVSAQIVGPNGPINCKSVEVSLTKTKKSEKFHAVIAMMDPAAQGLDAAAGQTITVLINGVQIGGAFNLEHVDEDFTKTEITISGRDVSSTLIDTQNTQTFTNQTPTQVVQSLASGVPTDADSITDSAGKIYQLDFNAITHRASSWEAIQGLADLYGKNAYITGGTLYVKDLDEQLPVYSIQWTPPSPSAYATGNFLTLKCSRNFQMSKQINVKSSGFNHKTKQNITATAQAGGSATGSLDYSIVTPGLNQDQHQNIATKKSKEHAKHAFDIDVEIRGDTSIVIRMQLQLSGTGTTFDQSYEIMDVEHKVAWDGGYTTTIKGKTDGGTGGSGKSGAPTGGKPSGTSSTPPPGTGERQRSSSTT